MSEDTNNSKVPKPSLMKDRKLSWGENQEILPGTSAESGGDGAHSNGPPPSTPPRGLPPLAPRPIPAGTVDSWVAMMGNSQGESFSPITPSKESVSAAGSDLSDMPDLAPKRETPSAVTLNDILDKNPYANEAENAIMDVVEHRARTRSTDAAISTSRILQNVPETNSFREPPPETQDTTSHVSKKSKDTIFSNDHRRTQTMENTLFNLAEEMHAMHNLDSIQDSDEEDSDDEEATPVAAKSGFLTDATLVFRGKSDGEKDSTKENAKKRWNALKATIDVAKISPSSTHGKNVAPVAGNLSSEGDVEEGRHKKTDEDIPPVKSIQEQSKKKKKKKHNRLGNAGVKAGRGLVTDAREFTKQRTTALKAYLMTLTFVVAPAVGVAFILFYLAGNPPTGRVENGATFYFNFTLNRTVLSNTDGEEIDSNTASASWWILFICVRQIITLSLAKMAQVIIVDFFCVSTRIFVNLFGQIFTLFVIQSRGWPFLLFFWALLDLGMLQGGTDFAKHWGHWQTYYFDTYLSLFTNENPSGGITENSAYRRVLIIAVAVGLIVSAKRLWVGFMLGKKIYRNYSEDLTKLMKKLILLGKIAFVARDLSRRQARFDREYADNLTVNRFGLSEDRYFGMLRTGPEDEMSVNPDNDVPAAQDIEDLQGRVIEGDDPYQLSQADRNRINEFLGAWEEPEKELAADETISIDSILQFRQSLSFLDNRYLFSIAWGDTSTRENAIMSSQQVYHRLNVQTPDTNTLRFDLIALAAIDQDGDIDTAILKQLIRLVRPDRDGNLTLLEFVKSVDAVYKEAKLLRAAVHNSEKVDRAFENVINIVFYVALGAIILSQSGISPMALFVSMSSFVLAFAFVIGSSMSKMFEGWLFILLQRPYDIGDRVHVSNINVDTSFDGSPGWVVKDVTLFNTTLIFGATNERATISNSSMASSRIINLARSQNAQVFIYFKFSVEVEYEKVQLFHEAMKKFVRARPREWASFGAFRPTKIMAEQGYIEYMTFLVHRAAWQDIGAVLTSKADINSFGLELSKKLDMRFKSPPLPVNLNMLQGGHDGDGPSMPEAPAAPKGHPKHTSSDVNSVLALFEKNN